MCLFMIERAKFLPRVLIHATCDEDKALSTAIEYSYTVPHRGIIATRKTLKFLVQF